MFYYRPKEKSTAEAPDHGYDLGVKGQGQLCLNHFIACNANSSFILSTEGYHILLMVCRIQLRLQIIAMALGSKVKVKYA